MSPGRIALGYGVIAILWIAFSDAAVTYFKLDPVVMTIKGAAFVFVTASLLYVTIRRLVQTVRRTSQERDETAKLYRTVVEASNEGICLLDQSGRIAFLNGRLAAMLGRPAEELHGKRLQDFVEEPHVFAQQGAQQSGTHECRLRADLDRKPWVLISRHPVPNEAGEVVQLVGTVMDITERKQAEEEVRKTAAQWQATFDAVQDVVLLLDKDGRILRANHAAAEFLGLPCDNIVGGRCYGLIHGTSTPPAECPLAKMRQSRRHEEAEILARQGGPWLSVSADPVFDPSGELTHVVHVARDITERKRAEDNLRQSAAYLAESQRLSHTGSWAFDVASDKYVYASEECGRIFEFDPHEGLPTREVVARLIHPEDWPGVNAAFEKTLRDKVDTASEFRITLPSGTAKHVHAIRHPVLNAAGEVVQLVGTVMDITERKRAEEERRHSAERFRAIADYTYDWEHWIGVDGKLLWVNPAVERITGYSVDECMVMPDFPIPIVAEADREAVAGQIGEAVQGSSRNDFEFRVRHKDGRLAWVAAAWQPIYDSRGARLGYRSSIRDIAERKQAENALRQSEAYLAEAQRLSHTGSWAFDVANNNYVYVSEECARIFELAGQKDLRTREAVARLIHPEDWPGVNAAFEKTLRDKVDTASEFRITLPSGTAKHVHAIRHPVLNAAGEVVQLVGTVMDITERKRAEEEHRAHVWFLESMDRVNRAMQGSNDLEQVTSDVLKVVLTIFGSDRAWLVYPCDPHAPTWRVAMEHTRPEFPGAFVPGLDLPVDAEVARVFETARHSGGAVRFGPGADQPLPAELAERFKIQSMIAMVVPPKLAQPYLFGLHQCSGPRVWAPTEERLFQEIGRRLTDALTSVLIFRTLRDSERRLEEAQRIAHVGYWDRDLVAGRITLSDEGARIFGLQPEERVVDLPLWHERWQTLIHPEDRPRAAAAAAAALAGGPRYDVEYRVVHRTGEVRIVHSQGDVIRDESGRPCRMFGIMHDITDRKRAEESLRQSEAYLAEAQRLSHTGSWALDVASGKYLYVSEEFCRIFGLDAQEGLPSRTDISRHLHPEDWDSANASFEKQLHEKVDNTIEYRIVLPGGTVKHIQAIRHPVLNEAGEVVQLVGTVMDITERKRAEQERDRLRQLEADLAHINRVNMMGELAASIAHEVGQPLSGVVSNGGACLRWLAREVPNLEEAREAAKRIVRDGKRAGEIIARIRAMTKKASTPNEKLFLNETIQDVLALVGDEVKRKGVILRPQFADDLLPVAGDRVQLQQVLMNLVLNGIEAMSSVADRPRDLVITTRNVEPDQVQVTVEDAGTGLDPTAMDKIFDPFYTTKASGMGMGLSICRSILQAHGGRLWATAKNGPGTVFHFTLPTYREDESHA